MKRLVRIGLIGAGFIGRSHGLAVRAVNGVFPGCPIDAEPHILADDAPGKAERAAAALGFRRSTADWREAVDAADAVIIAVPSNAHAEIARRAIAHAAALIRFASGAPGVIETSRVALGRKMDLTFEVTGERGALRFEAERMNEIGLYLDEKTGSGFRRILIEPAHPDYGAFLPAPGHGLGFNDLKTIEIKAFLDAIAAGENAQPDLAEAARIGRLCEAILDSAASGQWVQRPEDVTSSNRTAA